jgi:solute carrier family 8 (sodium/calcium exchanger)
LDVKDKAEDFGFECLHYSVSEGSGSIKIKVLNKKGTAGAVRVVTIDAEAIAGDDYDKVDKCIEFSPGEKFQYVEVLIHDDENWEPDEDFFVQLYNPQSGLELTGKDTRTRVTIIDDDKPGQICYEETKNIKVLASDKFCDVVILRKNGADGIVTVDFETKELD